MSTYVKQTPREQLSYIFRVIEDEKGATGLAEFVMETFETVLDSMKPKSVEDLYSQFYELFKTVKNTEPRISLVIFYFFEIWEELKREKENVGTVDEFKDIVLRVTKRIQVESDDEFRSIIRTGADSVCDGDVILVHSHSWTVRKSLALAVKQGKKFKVIIAEQEFDKTVDMVEYFSEASVDFKVVPEYMLSHITDEVRKVFFGATTLDYEQQFICDAGSYAVLTEFHAEHIPNYMFLSTKKFSLWKSEKKHETFKTSQKKTYTTTKKVIDYERIKYSHDRVPGNLFDHIVTELGTFNPEKTKELYMERYKEREKMRKEFFTEV